MLHVNQIILSLEEDKALLPEKLLAKLRIPSKDLRSWHIVKESIDARKGVIRFSYVIACEVAHEKDVLKRCKKDVSIAQDKRYVLPKQGIVGFSQRPIVVGFGPAGMFATLLLAQMGYRPIVFERGACVEERIQSVEEFWSHNVLDPISNVQFGEGGAGTFSDGKLTTRIKDLRIHKILEELVRFGAPEDILYTAHPHIGTDVLRDIVKRIRKECIALGADIHFKSQVQDVHVEHGALCGVRVNDTYIACEHLILAIGHSARDTIRMLIKRGVCVEPKAFAIGARIEHPQSLIDAAQYKAFANHPKLPSAEYRLTHTAKNGRGVYTFCMCPGGYVVPSTSIEHGVVVNGMSCHARDGENANAALLVQIRPEDFGNDAEGGLKFQEAIEQQAYRSGGENYHAPIQLVKDFLAHRKSTMIGSVKPTYACGVTPSDLHTILPSYVCEAMEEAIVAFDHKLHGFAMEDAILTGVETRSSSPVRIVRDEGCMAMHIVGLYPCGEGAGYAGGIVSAAIDGLRCAEKIIETYRFVE